MKWCALSMLTAVLAGCASAERSDPNAAGAPAMREAADPDAVLREVLRSVTAPTVDPEAAAQQ